MQKTSLRHNNTRKAIIKSLNSHNKKELSVFLPAIIKFVFKIKNIYKVLIGVCFIV